MPSIILTRPAEECARTAPLFERHGFRVYAAPLVELRRLSDDACGIRSVRRLAGGEGVVLTSAFATDLWLDLRETHFHEHVPACYWVVGERSARLLREGDPDVPVRAVAASAEELLRDSFEGVERLLYPCSTERRDTLADGLRERGIQVVEFPLYSPAMPPNAAAALRHLFAEAEPPLAITFFSPSAVKHYYRAGMLSESPAGAIFAAIGATTAAELAAIGIDDALVPDTPGAEALAALLASAFAPGR